MSRRQGAGAKSRTAGRSRWRATLSDSIAPAHRQRDQVVARRGDARTQPATLRAEHQDHPAAPVHRAVRGPRAGRGAVAPAARRLRDGEEVGEVADARDRQVLDRARRRLADGRRHLGRAPLGRSRPVAPVHSALRPTAPRFCGSVTSSSATITGSGAREQRRRRRRSGTPPRRRTRPDGRPSRRAARSPPRSPASRPGTRAPRPAWPTPAAPAAGPRTASRTALRP